MGVVKGQKELASDNLHPMGNYYSRERQPTQRLLDKHNPSLLLDFSLVPNLKTTTKKITIMIN